MSSTATYLFPTTTRVGDGNHCLLAVPPRPDSTLTSLFGVTENFPTNSLALGLDQSVWQTAVQSTGAASPSSYSSLAPPSPPSSFDAAVLLHLKKSEPARTSSLVHRRSQVFHSRGATQRMAESPGDPGGLSCIGDAEPLDVNVDLTTGHEPKLEQAGPCATDVHRQYTVKSEQRRRNDLRGGFARLKNALPASPAKCSKVVLLDRATTYIGHLEAKLRDMQDVVAAIEACHVCS
ncbi:helix loop helix DNA-binding domain protein [Ceratobasidium sp. AG-Ba]|nr:helix loop helix DNA-binding domain protein [Ceratobasidium sp. AG-Ba]QRW03416.1 helix loop helix DNA-binding domain protein [Ceratobasidium sp. AG-Ba]